MKPTVNLDDLQCEATKLVALLTDREPGLASWNMMLAERIRAMAKLTAPFASPDEDDPE